MPGIPHLHINERVLYRSRHSLWALLTALFHAFWQGGVLGAILAFSLAGITALLWGLSSPLLTATIFLLTLLLLLLRRFFCWRNTTITITTQRILVVSYDLLLEGGKGKGQQRVQSLFRATTQTVRWEAYQESVYEGGLFAELTNCGTLTIRHGTMDAARSVTITSLPYAKDLKHYLDKIHSLRHSEVPDSELPAFVRARKGRRDHAVLSYL